MPDGSDITVASYDLLMKECAEVARPCRCERTIECQGFKVKGKVNALPHVIAVLLGLRSWGCPDANLDELYHGLGYEAFHSVFLS